MEFKICQSSLLHCVIASFLNFIKFRELQVETYVFAELFTESGKN